MNEKKFNIIVVSVAFAAILLVILLSIPWGGDKKAIMNEFESLDRRDHVFVSIDYNKLMKKIENGETFQVFIGSNQGEDVNQFVFETNKLAKQYNVKTIYYLRLHQLSNKEIVEIKSESSQLISFPSLIYWVGNEGNRSTAKEMSGLEDINHYDNNWHSLLKEYFELCYED